MSRFASALLSATLFAAAAATSACTHSPSDLAAEAGALSPAAREAAAIVDDFHAALGRNDTAGALALLAEDALIFESGYIERSKAEYAEHHLAADAAFASAVASTLAQRSGAAAGSLAWVASEGRTTGRFKDRDIDQMTTESMVLRRDASGWRILHIHWSSRKAEAQ
jgi:ketosteroid isomerase-like protein